MMATLDLDTPFALASRIAVLADKHVIAAGTPQQIVGLQDPFVQRFFLGERGQRALQALQMETGMENRHGK